MVCAAVAQWIEYWPPKPRVVGSIPASRANESSQIVSNHLETRMFYSIAGFLLSKVVSFGLWTYQHFLGIFVGI